MTLSTALTALDATRASVLADLDAFSPEQRTFSPSADAWSPEQVAEHLLAVERGILAGILHAPEADLGTPSSKAVEGLIAFMQSDGLATTPPFLHPTGMPYAESRRGLEAVGPDWHALVASRADAPQDSTVFSHPVSGPMTLLDTIRFVDAHAGHHRHQLSRIRAAEGLPV